MNARSLNQLKVLHLQRPGIIMSLWLISYFCSGQPVWETRRVDEDLILFEDLRNPTLRYYAPGRLKLKIKENGQPDFIMTQLRYTGVSLSGDQGDKRFTNIVQMTIQMEDIDVVSLDKMKNRFRLRPGIKLSPLPIRNLESALIFGQTTLDPDQNQKKLKGYVQGNEGSGSNGSGSGIYWTERNFTLALDNHESQILEDQLKNNRLAFSFSYAFYADVMIKSYKEIITSGSPEFKKQFQSTVAEVNEPDTSIAQMVVKANAFSISIDLAQWPGCIKKIDINQNNTPPAYAYVEVRCHDFNNKIRDDLFFKTFELEAQGVSGDPVIGELKFAASKPELHTMTVKFPYAVKMNKPPRYRITETNDAGERVILPWIYLNSWKPMIDITSTLDQLDVMEKSIDVELDPAWLETNKPERVELWTRYSFLHKPRVQLLAFNKEDLNALRNINLKVDKNSKIQYRVILFPSAIDNPGPWRTMDEDYLLIK